MSSPLEYIPAGGQSLSIGYGYGNSDPEYDQNTVTRSPVYPDHNLMFNTGTRGVRGAILNGATLTDFVPAYEQDEGRLGETQGSGMMRHIYFHDQEAGNSHKTLIYRTHGNGGASIEELEKGTRPYDNSLKELNRAINIASGYGREVSVRAVTWTQGQADTGTGEQDYYDALSQLFDDYKSDYSALLPASNPDIKMIIDQHTGGEFTAPGSAQYRLARDRADAFMSCTKYFMQRGSGVHLTGKWYSILGEYQGRAWRSIYETGDWAPLWPLSVTRTGAVITAQFNVPTGSIAFDTSTLPGVENMGFVFTDDSGATPAITDVSIVGVDTVEITLDSTPTGASQALGYATEPDPGAVGFGAWGNLRDSDTEPSQTDPSILLHNWCVVFEEPVIEV